MAAPAQSAERSGPLRETILETVPEVVFKHDKRVQKAIGFASARDLFAKSTVRRRPAEVPLRKRQTLALGGERAFRNRSDHLQLESAYDEVCPFYSLGSIAIRRVTGEQACGVLLVGFRNVQAAGPLAGRNDKLGSAPGTSYRPKRCEPACWICTMHW